MKRFIYTAFLVVLAQLILAQNISNLSYDRKLNLLGIKDAAHVFEGEVIDVTEHYKDHYMLRSKLESTKFFAEIYSQDK